VESRHSDPVRDVAPDIVLCLFGGGVPDPSDLLSCESWEELADVPDLSGRPVGLLLRIASAASESIEEKTEAREDACEERRFPLDLLLLEALDASEPELDLLLLEALDSIEPDLDLPGANARSERLEREPSEGEREVASVLPLDLEPADFPDPE